MFIYVIKHAVTHSEKMVVHSHAFVLKPIRRNQSFFLFIYLFYFLFLFFFFYHGPMTLVGQGLLIIKDS